MAGAIQAGNSPYDVIDFEDDSRRVNAGTTIGISGGATYLVRDSIAVSLLAEENLGSIVDSHFRLFAILDLAYQSRP